MDEESTSIAGWVAGVFGVLLALVAWGRDAWKQRHEHTLKIVETTAKKEEKTLDATSEVAKSMLLRISKLEEREETNRKEATAREDTLRVRLDGVEAEADECQRAQAVLKEQYRVSLEEIADVREENETLRKRVLGLEGQNVALNRELNDLYRSIGVKRPSSPSVRPAHSPVTPPQRVEVTEVEGKKRSE